MELASSSVWTITKTLLKRSLQLIGVLILIACIYYAKNIYHIYKWNPVVLPATSYLYGEADSLEQAQREDIAFLRKLPRIDRSFSPQALVAFSDALDTLESSAGEWSDAQFALAAAEAVAFADNGHTAISQRNLLSRFNRLPLRFYWFGEDLHVVRAHNEYANLLGQRVSRIGNFDIEEAVAHANRYFGGPDNWRRYLSTAVLESPELLAASGISDSSKEIQVTFVNESGGYETVQISALPQIEDANFSGRYPWMVLSPAPFPGENGEWITIGDRWSEQPIRFKHPSVPYQFDILEQDNGLYIRLDLMLSYNDNNIETFWESVNEAITALRFDYILLDMRNSPGGDYTTSVAHVERLPQYLSQNGTLYIATSNASFSAAIVNTSVAKYHGGSQAKIIGERVGDRDQFWAEGGLPFTLPHSKLTFSYATAYHDWVNGCTGEHPYCFTLNAEIENEIDSLSPNIPLIYTFDDFVAGANPILDYIRG